MKATYNLKGKTINLEKLYNEQKGKGNIELSFNPESLNKRLMVTYNGIGFWLSYSGKVMLFGVKPSMREQVKEKLVDFYIKVLKNYLN